MPKKAANPLDEAFLTLEAAHTRLFVNSTAKKALTPNEMMDISQKIERAKVSIMKQMDAASQLITRG